jgi:hypothetical protein
MDSAGEADTTSKFGRVVASSCIVIISDISVAVEEQIEAF